MSLPFPAKWDKWLILAAGLVLAYIGLKVHDHNVRVAERIELQVDSLNHAVDSLNRSRNYLQVVNAKLQDTVVHLTHRATALTLVAKAAVSRADSLSQALSRQLPDSLRPALGELDSSYHAALAAKDSVISVYVAAAQLKDQQISNLTWIVRQDSSVIAGLRTQRDIFAHKANPGLLKRAASSLPFVAVALISEHLAHR